MDQAPLAESVSEKIPYEFFDYFLIKPLDPIKVKKEFSKPVAKDNTENEGGIEIVDYDKVETEIKEVDSDYRKAVVLKIPTSYVRKEGDGYSAQDIKVGDIILIKDRSSYPFDLIRDSRLVKGWEILGVVK